MPTSPSYYQNSPTSGTEYWSHMWCGCVANSGDTLTVHVNAYTGQNGSGSLIAVSTLTAVIWDQTSNSQLNSFTGSNANTTTVSSSATTGHWVKCAAKYTGSGVGSLRMYLVYGPSSTAFVPTTPSFTPSVAGIGASVTVTGSRFTDATSVKFNGVAASFTINSDTNITATVPSGATTGPINVGNPAGSSNSSGNFTIAGGYVFRSGIWQPSAGVFVERSGVETQAQGVAVLRSSVWTPGG